MKIARNLKTDKRTKQWDDIDKENIQNHINCLNWVLGLNEDGITWV